MERFEIVVTSDADRDLDEIFAYFAYIAQTLQAPETATDMMDRIYAALYSLNEMPERHPLPRDAFLANQGFRILQIGKYSAFYVVDKDSKRVIVHRVLYGKRNYLRFFPENS